MQGAEGTEVQCGDQARHIVCVGPVAGGVRADLLPGSRGPVCCGRLRTLFAENEWLVCIVSLSGRLRNMLAENEWLVCIDNLPSIAMLI